MVSVVGSASKMKKQANKPLDRCTESKTLCTSNGHKFSLGELTKSDPKKVTKLGEK